MPKFSNRHALTARLPPSPPPKSPIQPSPPSLHDTETLASMTSETRGCFLARDLPPQPPAIRELSVLPVSVSPTRARTREVTSPIRSLSGAVANVGVLGAACPKSDIAPRFCYPYVTYLVYFPLRNPAVWGNTAGSVSGYGSCATWLVFRDPMCCAHQGVHLIVPRGIMPGFLVPFW